MIHIGTGLSQLEDTRKAAHEAASLAAMQLGAKRAELALVFATIEHCRHYPDLLAGLKEAVPVDHVVGCSGRGVLTLAAEVEDGAGLTVMLLSSDTVRCLPFLVPNLQEDPERAGRHIADRLKPELHDQSLVLTFPDPFSFQPHPFFRGVQSGLDSVEIVGGAAGEDGHHRQTFQFYDDQIVSDAVAGVGLTGRFRYHIGLTQAYVPLSDLLTITRGRGNVIAELNGQPAAQVLHEVTKPFGIAPREALLHVLGLGIPTRESPDGMIRRGHYLVRNLVGVDFISGALATADAVAESQRVFFVIRDPRHAKEDASEMLEEAAGAIGHPAGGLYFNCCSRGAALYLKPNVDTHLIRQRFGTIPLAGFLTYAEIAPILHTPHLHSYSGVAVFLSD